MGYAISSAGEKTIAIPHRWGDGSMIMRTLKDNLWTNKKESLD